MPLSVLGNPRPAVHQSGSYEAAWREVQGALLSWLDCRELGMDAMALSDFFKKKVKVGLDDGYIFGPSGAGFERINIACPRATLQEALTRIEKAVNGL